MAAAGKRNELMTVLLGGIAMLPGTWAALGQDPGALDRPMYDLLVRDVVPRGATDDSVVFVDIDDGTLQGLSMRWPFPRATWAQLVHKLALFGPSVIALDAFFPEPSSRADADLALTVADRIRDTPLVDVPEGVALADELDKQAAFRDADRQLSKAIAEAGCVVLGVTDGRLLGDSLSGGEVAELQPVPGIPVEVTPDVVYDSPRGSIPELAMAARTQAGLVVPYADDGIMRRYSYVARAGQKNIASLALAAVQVALPARAAALGKAVVAVDSGEPLLRWVHVGKIKHVSVIDVLEAKDDDPVLKRALAGRILFIGVSAVGAADRRQTPLRSDLPGTYVHITAAMNLLTGQHTQTGGATPRCLAWSLVALCLVLYLAWRRVTHTGLVIALALSATAAWTGLGIYGLSHGWLVPIVPAAIGFLLPVTGEIALRVGRAEASRQQIRNAFQFYLSPAVVEELVSNPDALKLGGQRREITAFFSDVAGFTTLSEKLDPAELTTLLNEYLGAMTDVILDEGGTVDKYIGDAIVAMFGAPLDQPDHAVRACRAAVRCNEKLEDMKAVWRSRGIPEINARIGLNSGIAVVGNMGSARRFDYTMLGDAVNLAARLEGANKYYRTVMMVGSETARLAADGAVFRKLDLVMVKGKKQGIAVYELVGLPGKVDAARLATVQAYEAGLSALHAIDFPKARGVLEPLAAAGDGPAVMLVDRLAELEAHPPAPGWDGVHELLSK
ncbi:MAG: adenylate/guanylate cyclase domain-containing protein [Myxococcales bacterium]|nr:adenylate/guanylate cyclase domain-containing protein [Myxococcales bacterium]